MKGVVRLSAAALLLAAGALVILHLGQGQLLTPYLLLALAGDRDSELGRLLRGQGLTPEAILKALAAAPPEPPHCAVILGDAQRLIQPLADQEQRLLGQQQRRAAADERGNLSSPAPSQGSRDAQQQPQVGIEEHLGRVVPLDTLKFKDEDGQPAPAGAELPRCPRRHS